MIISLDFQDIVKGAFFHVRLGFASDESKSDFIGLTESEWENHGSERVLMLYFSAYDNVK